MSSPLFVNGEEIGQDRHGNYNVEDFCLALFPDSYRMALQAEQLTSELYISDVTDFLKTIAAKTGEPLKKLSAALKWGNEQTVRLRRRGRKRAPSPAPVEDESFPSSLEDDEDEEEEEEEIKTPKTPRVQKRVRAPMAPVKRNMRQHASFLEANSKALASLSPLCADMGEFGRLARSAAIPYIEALRKAGPLRIDPPPEDASSPLFCVSQRLRQLGEDPDDYNASALGKRSLELYREQFPGQNPPQRVALDRHGRQYMINVYTPEICKSTIDVAVQECNNEI